ncbi:hypothetical protein [Alkalicoccus luteus]|uniref:hypothetical protein n=1 Tax=Alkalicoccus luteus TaxID=1237094 RepID=UPI0040348107
MLQKLIFIAAIAVLFFGFAAANMEPSLFTALSLGIPLTLFFLLMGVKEWTTSGKTSSVVLFIGSGAIFIYMLRTSLAII